MSSVLFFFFFRYTGTLDSLSKSEGQRRSLFSTVPLQKSLDKRKATYPEDVDSLHLVSPKKTKQLSTTDSEFSPGVF